jgi:DNA-binding transcriptional regulator YhcF (GntR family)
MLLQLNFASSVPIYMQIRNQIILGIASGSLPPGEKLPTVRALADESGVNMMTVSKAYQLLKQEGYIAADRRSGAVVIGGDAGKNEITDKSKAELKLILSEAKLKGMSRNLYDELEVEGIK